MKKKGIMKIALCVTSRIFFPEELIGTAKKEIAETLCNMDFELMEPKADVIPSGMVKTFADGKKYANFLQANQERIDGVILVLPNFGDEIASAEALRDCSVPVYLIACPDDLDKMDFANRRDAFCGKLSIMDVFMQYGIRYTVWEPHVLSPGSPVFKEQIIQFAAVCRIVKTLKHARIGAIGARPTAFKTVRCDETTLQKYGISVEAFDNSDLMRLAEKINPTSSEFTVKKQTILAYADFADVPHDRVDSLTRLAVVLDRLIKEYALDAISLRCWSDLQENLNVSPCVLLGMLGSRGIPAACELDTGNAVVMLALQAASSGAATCLDWNNNYASEPNRCFLFHCGPVPRELMTNKGRIVDHPMFAKVYGKGVGYGCNVGRLRPMPITFACLSARNGEIRYYFGMGKIRDEELPKGYFGCGASADFDGLQKKLVNIGRKGFRHHVSICEGNWGVALDEAFSNYLRFTREEI